ncbi:MAG: trans-sulfuration enzyme family protein [Bacteroidota bacterium]
MNIKDKGFYTKMVHAGTFEDPLGSVNVPIYQTSTFAFKNSDHGAACFRGDDPGFIYTRIGNPTITAFEENIAALENGYGGIACSSGMGAISTIFMALLEQGAHILSTASVYGPTRSILEKHFSRFGVENTFIDTSDIELIKHSLLPNTRVLYIETPANPTMQITDLKACAEIAREHNLILVVDNTFCSPYLQNPIDFGVDLVVHSITKFINGHADIVGGVIVTKNREMYDKIRPMMVMMGTNMDPHQAFMVLRGVKTLGLRVEKSQETAREVADYLSKHPKIEWVKYPGLESHPQFKLAKSQMRGPGSMISFELKGGIEAGKILMDNVKLAVLAVSLGGVETLIQHPASMTHSGVPRDERIGAGITDGLVRFSVGIEDAGDILGDLKQALEKV